MCARAHAHVCFFLSSSLSLPDLFSSWKLSWGWKEWRLGWPGGLGREAGENTFQILIKSLFVVCSLQPLFLSIWVSPSLFISSCLSLSPRISPSPPVSLLLPSQSPCLLPWISLSPSLLSVSLSPDPSMFLTPLSASTSVCPSLPVLVHLSVSLRLPVRGCLCPSAPPPICLVVCASPSEGTRSLTKAPSPRSAKASPGSEGGEGGTELQLLEASVAAGLSWEFGASQLQKRSLPWAPKPRTPEQRGEKAGPLAAESVCVYVCVCVCVKRRQGASLCPHFTISPPKPGPGGEEASMPTFLIPSPMQETLGDPGGKGWRMPGLG